MSTPPAEGRLPVLDGLRAMAILLVLARHAARPFQPADGAPLLPVLGHDALGWALNGWIGVDLFFVLSGFLIARHLLRAGPGASFAGYLAQRALRIVPAYWAVLFAAALGAFPFFDPGEELLRARVAYHLLFLQDYLPADIVVSFWSLGVEEKFYLVAPALLALTLRARRLRARLLVLAALGALSPLARWLTSLGQDGAPTYEAFFPLYRSPFHACLEPLLVGVACALLHRAALAGQLGWLPRAARPLFWSGLGLLAVLALGRDMLGRIGPFEIVAQPSLLALACGAVLLGAVRGAGGAGWLGHRAWAVPARLSYAAYLVHMPLIPLALRAAASVTPEGAPPALQLAAFLPPYLLATAAAALLLHHLVEQPFLRLKRRLAEGRPPEQAARLAAG